MIKQDLGETTLQGDASIIISELASLTNAVAKEISQGSTVTYDMVLNKVKETVDIYRLTDTGMSPKEAIEVLGYTDKIKQAYIVEENGTKSLVIGKENEQGN